MRRAASSVARFERAQARMKTGVRLLVALSSLLPPKW